MLKKQKKIIHFLHIGKTGGTAIKSILQNYLETDQYYIILHHHNISLKDIPKGEYVIFFLRDPISRFISGFYSRQRKGQPRYYFEWSNEEKEIFETFLLPNQLAISLADKNSKNYKLSLRAMKNIQHFRTYKNWYSSLEYFNSRINDILFIGFQESLDNDFIRLKQILNIHESVKLPIDEITAHKNPKNIDKYIDKKGILKLKQWYHDDFEFILRCKKMNFNNKFINSW